MPGRQRATCRRSTATLLCLGFALACVGITARSGLAAPVPPAASGGAPVSVGVPASSGAPAPATAPRALGLLLETGTGRLISLAAPATSVFAADPHVAEVRAASPTTLFVLGIAPGRTTIAAIGDTGAPIVQYDVTVMPSSFAAAQASAAIAKVLPGRNIRVTAEPNSLVITGTLRTASEANDAVRTARGFLSNGQNVESRLIVLGAQQVNIRVRIAEVDRNVMRQLGVNWAAFGNIGTLAKFAPFPALVGALNGGSATSIIAPQANPYPTLAGGPPVANNPLSLGGNINAVIDALAQDQLVHVLAEPNLTAISGETASFLVGGEFPIPVAQQNNQVTIEFKQYGVSLAFVPTVEADDRITMKVRPEVSALTSVGAVQLSVGNSSIQVPALTVRRAETTVELASGQSFAIAGLLQDNNTLTGNALPGIGELPVLGALFRSDAFQRNQTELMIVVTPYLVRGVDDPARIKLPTDNWQPPSDLERLLLLRQSARGGQPQSSAQHIPGDAGFVVQ
jgi:pilus assembly protein CpaC